MIRPVAKPQIADNGYGWDQERRMIDVIRRRNWL
ncbi:hypothetical protein L288_06485 [Sphingobium quisquiliarum P25]|uniref:Uncharacterized protein n=1 Tax=Sphingobium quisquiliarum P25 TaxID=1329909 RepID=T0IBU9_9SPHN|nr:hypothetical protein L288_06485 [Sphingobium quisquiliarum P25]